VPALLWTKTPMQLLLLSAHHSLSRRCR
jgi:hypothetical protein